MNNDIGQRIREARKASGLTQEQLAERMHLSRQTISHWENGRAEPNYESLKMLAEIVGVDMRQLFAAEPAEEAVGGKDEEPEPRSPAADGHTTRRILPAVLVLLAVLVCAGYALKRLDSGRYSRHWFMEETRAAENRAHVQIYTHASPVRFGAEVSDKWEFTLYFREVNGVGVEVEKIHRAWFHRSGRKKQVTLDARDFRAYTGSSYIGANEIRFMQTGVTDDGDYVLFGCALEGKDDLGNDVVFRMSVPLER